jgi:SpoVK/Ycf46/Vps4 family AAA+-type ATPase
MSKYKLFSQYLDVYRKKTHLTVGEYKNIIDYTNRIFHSITPEHISLMETDSFTSYDVWQKDHEFVIDEIIASKKTLVHIHEKINTIADLLAVIDKYPVHEDAEYNINMSVLHNISGELKELDSMIGMTQLKKNILDQILYFLQGFSGSGDYKHIVIYGSPGTGKTDIAKILGKMYSKMGVVKSQPVYDKSLSTCDKPLSNRDKPRFKKATRTDLVAGYLGQTAIKTRALINECLGGVLFIDEIYSLGDDSFSKECADTLCEALSDHKDGLIVIVAGYEACVNERFFKLNPGLESRFSWRFTIDDYTSSEVWQIFKKKVADSDWTHSISESVGEDWFRRRYKDLPGFGRDIDALFFKVKIAHSRRMYGAADLTLVKNVSVVDLDAGFVAFKESMKKSALYGGDKGYVSSMFL